MPVFVIIYDESSWCVSAMAVFPDVRRMMLLRRAIPMRRKRTVADRLRSVRQQRGGRFPGIKRRRRRRRLRQQHGRGFSLPDQPYVTLRR